MAVPVISLNLVPRPSLWRRRHQAFGWIALGVGVLFLAGAVGLTWRAYHQAGRAGRDAVSLTEEAKRAARQEQLLQASLQNMDASKEQSRWKLAERILQERSLPWSRLTAELEQCMVPDLRLKGLQRTRSSTQQVVMKLKGEARTRQAESAFVESLRQTPVFAQVILERESERAGGGWDFEISLPAAAVPPPFQVKAIQQRPAAPAPPARPAAATVITKPAPPPPVRPAAPLIQSPPATKAAPAATVNQEEPARSRPPRRRPSRSTYPEEPR